MASTPLILALVVLTAIILVLLIIGVLIRYTRERRSRRSQRRAQLNRDAALAAEDAENSARLHCTYQPSGLPHGASHRVVDGAVEGVQLQTLFRPERSDSGDKAEIWLKRGASNDYTRAEHGRVADGNGRGIKFGDYAVFMTVEEIISMKERRPRGSQESESHLGPFETHGRSEYRHRHTNTALPVAPLSRLFANRIPAAYPTTITPAKSTARAHELLPRRNQTLAMPADMDIDFTRRNKKPRPLSEHEKEKLDEFVDAIHYSARYSDDEYEYRHVQLPKQMLKIIPKDYFDGARGTLKLLWEEEWRALGITQSLGWEHYEVHEPEPHILLFKRPINYQPPTH
ncbi:cyclin-dependent protein serine/threonine kinase regulator [Ascochyta rabiei]|uniref:Cyclin-dependent kinases regulatory subunit n=2 Tax=Didymella rabiei TaxID=5454 RepID=A0A163I611_DIDRA|nr:cyclin-dependent protein serine/threonine kinase regulator [Ascochyta rabiei]